MPLLPFTPNPTDPTTTTINTIPLNLSALTSHNYTLYTNNTLSNISSCILVFPPFTPSLLPNGTWLHATTCYVPVHAISPRGTLCIALGTLFGLTLVPSLVNLKKHGAQFLREDARFRLVGRRWQWYWMVFVAVCGMVSLFAGVDVDRYYLQQVPIVLQCLFFTLMGIGGLAVVWEGARGWGSWEERKGVDGGMVMGEEGKRRRMRVETYAPLVFYLFAGLDFFVTIPRSWTAVQRQNSPEESWDVARPAATDARNKAGAILAVGALGVVIFSLLYSIRVYKKGHISACPRRFFTSVILLGIRLAYGIAAAWSWDISIFNKDVSIGWPFGLGYAPILLILIEYNIAGFWEENEDKQLIAQRVARGRVQDAELGIVKKPSWWNRNAAARFASSDEQLRNMAAEIDGARPTARAVEMTSVRQRSANRRVGVEHRFKDEDVDGHRRSQHVDANAGVRTQVNDSVDATSKARGQGQPMTSLETDASQQRKSFSMLDV